MTRKDRIKKRRSVQERWQEYERLKREIYERHLSERETDKEIRKLARRLRI